MGSFGNRPGPGLLDRDFLRRPADTHGDFSLLR
jgi:hypothetical protein